VGYIQDALYRQAPPPISKQKGPVSDEVPGGRSFRRDRLREHLRSTAAASATPEHGSPHPDDDQGYLVARTDEAMLTGNAVEPVDLYEQQRC